MSEILSKLKNIYLTKKGIHTSRQILVIESDDWGGIRMPSQNTYNKLIKEGDISDKNPFLKFDCLEREEDFHLWLSEVAFQTGSLL